MTVEETIVFHAQPHGTTFEKLLHAGCVSFEIVPLLWLPPHQKKRKPNAGEIEQTLSPAISGAPFWFPFDLPCSAAVFGSGRAEIDGARISTRYPMRSVSGFLGASFPAYLEAYWRTESAPLCGQTGAT